MNRSVGNLELDEVFSMQRFFESQIAITTCHFVYHILLCQSYVFHYYKTLGNNIMRNGFSICVYIYMYIRLIWLQMVLESSESTTWRQQFGALREALGGCDFSKSEMHLEAVMATT
jgi:hypothetical protein